MQPSVQELEEIANNLAHLFAQGRESRTESLLREHGILGLAGRIALVPIRIALFFGGLASAFLFGVIGLNKWSSSLLNLENILLGGLLAAAVFWLLVMRRFPFLAPLLSIAILLGILVRGGGLRWTL